MERFGEQRKVNAGGTKGDSGSNGGDSESKFQGSLAW